MKQDYFSPLFWGELFILFERILIFLFNPSRPVPPDGGRVQALSPAPARRADHAGCSFSWINGAGHAAGSMTGQKAIFTESRDIHNLVSRPWMVKDGTTMDMTAVPGIAGRQAVARAPKTVRQVTLPGGQHHAKTKKRLRVQGLG
ncbi:hypothetical protein K2X14_06360 [Acetobacter sp. TBRC 12305]|uniref:hypothetical protein n=1 Tax=Acetobacter garciniae TaxID=2817435 RepID=UPI001C72D91B|nr:hypothetical protein [Acetobacter garciniae]MBX0344460.1 hypothetical protein [Acetobacter garciniae]